VSKRSSGEITISDEKCLHIDLNHCASSTLLSEPMPVLLAQEKGKESFTLPWQQSIIPMLSIQESLKERTMLSVFELESLKAKKFTINTLVFLLDKLNALNLFKTTGIFPESAR